MPRDTVIVKEQPIVTETKILSRFHIQRVFYTHHCIIIFGLFGYGLTVVRNLEDETMRQNLHFASFV